MRPGTGREEPGNQTEPGDDAAVAAST
jgi:hypothetical protein